LLTANVFSPYATRSHSTVVTSLRSSEDGTQLCTHSHARRHIYNYLVYVTPASLSRHLYGARYAQYKYYPPLARSIADLLSMLSLRTAVEMEERRRPHTQWLLSTRGPRNSTDALCRNHNITAGDEINNGRYLTGRKTLLRAFNVNFLLQCFAQSDPVSRDDVHPFLDLLYSGSSEDDRQARLLLAKMSDACGRLSGQGAFH
jgi:hypothetical protein